MIKWVMTVFFFLFFFDFTQVVFADVFPAGTKYQVCFSPQQPCANMIVKLIKNAKHTLFIQSYSFTSRVIEKALVQALKRGVEVRIICDKSQFSGNFYTSARKLYKQGALEWMDYTLNIAHNKVLIADKKIVETGSFNFTNSAQKYNAENVLIIYDQTLALRYLGNWYQRQRLSTPVTSSKFIYYQNRARSPH